jgi:hypothetical protein
VERGAAWVHGSRGNPLTELARRYGVPTLPDDHATRLVGRDEERSDPAGVGQWQEDFKRVLEESKLIVLEQGTDMPLGMAARVVSARLDEPRFQEATEWGLAWLSLVMGVEVERLSAWDWDQDTDFYGPDLIFPRGYDRRAGPAAALQGTLGLGRETEMTLRWVPSIEFDEEVGSISSFGVGAKHALDQWFTRPLPVGIAVAAGVQTFDVGDYATADASHVSLIVSKDLASLTLFTAGTLEQSSVEVEYTVENPRLPENQETISFTEDGANGAHLTAGLTLDVYVVRLGATYSVSDYSVLSAGLGVTF